jgi:hypothetical protein
VVVTQGGQIQGESLDEAKILAAVEQLEADYSLDGRSPAVPATDSELKEFSYRTDGDRFEIERGNVCYDSASGIQIKAAEKAGRPAYSITGYLETVEEGWGPWRRSKQLLTSGGKDDQQKLGWLAQVPETPAWSARMYFPIDEEHTGYYFRRPDGSSAYQSGELLYDGVSGTFQVKLHRKEEATEGKLLSARLMEKELNGDLSACELVGDSGFLADLGISTPSTEEPVVHLSSSSPLRFSAHDALDGLLLASLGRHSRALDADEFTGAGVEQSGSMAAVGKLRMVDKLGQVHSLRVRAGRGGEYDWVVGQLCPLEGSDSEVKVAESRAYDDVLDKRAKATIVAGE